MTRDPSRVRLAEPAEPPPRRRSDPVYGRLWRIVDGALRATLTDHPEYAALLQEPSYSFRASAAKRVTGALLEAFRAAERGPPSPGATELRGTDYRRDERAGGAGPRPGAGVVSGTTETRRASSPGGAAPG